MTRPACLDTEVFLRVLGDELRRERKRRGWTRKDLEARLAVNVSLQTLATYELGKRQCTVVRLVELADALEVSALDLLARALGRVRTGDEAAGRLEIDLATIVRDHTAELAPLRRWARACLVHAPAGAPTSVRLEMPVLARWAEACGIGASGLIRRLRSLPAGAPA